jgi:NAD(P)-dependent dehydrogenase (short-subunit alcohol dehydrogenase family)
VYRPGRDGRITDIDEAVWEKVLAINLRGVFLFCKYGIPLMMEHGGSIVNTASSAGMIGIPGCDAYTATKGAIVQLTKSMAAEYGRYKIRVNCIAPAAIMTPMMRQSNPENSTFDENSFLNLRTPLRRYGTPEEIAQVARFLASDDASYLNGAIVVADGGITINGDLSYPDK